MVYDANSEVFSRVTGKLSDVASFFYDQGWMYATSGNLSAVLNDDPLELAISASGAMKGALDQSQFIIVNSNGDVVSGDLKPSAETLLHIEVVKMTGAKNIFHTHSMWTTILSQRYGEDGGFYLKHMEMLKALDGVKTHHHEEWIPIIENSQNMKDLSLEVERLLDKKERLHCFLLKGHGMYTWGNSIEQTRINVEALEFMMGVHGMSTLLQKV